MEAEATHLLTCIKYLVSRLVRWGRCRDIISPSGMSITRHREITLVSIACSDAAKRRCTKATDLVLFSCAPIFFFPPARVQLRHSLHHENLEENEASAKRIQIANRSSLESMYCLLGSTQPMQPLWRVVGLLSAECWSVSLLFPPRRVGTRTISGRIFLHHAPTFQGCPANLSQPSIEKTGRIETRPFTNQSRGLPTPAVAKGLRQRVRNRVRYVTTYAL